ncbi:MAG: glycosyltransferase [Lachnospiraceae bacterium]|nr:glycosyltransferase [Lachnospiraceae bacterium]MBQ8947998.1 glycosyltransferase [Lachnospiraceae bacterium]
MKTILHITECLGSGVLNYVKNITTWQVKDYKVVVAYSTRPETPENFKNQFDKRVQFIKVNGFTREIEPKNDLKAFIHIKKIVKKLNPDLIHLHSTKAGILGRWAINCDKYKVFYSPHAYSFLMQDVSIRKRNLYKLIERLSNRKNCLTIADIDGELEASKQVTKNAICIPNGINPDEMDEIIEQAKPLVEKFDKTTVCLSGKIVPQKNPKLFNEIAEALPEYNFLWIGAGPLEHELKSPNITITGWVRRPEAVAKIMSSDIFLFTSLWESLSIALMEVMYLAKPCVVSKCDGNKDVIKTRVNGYLCVKKEEYVEAIRNIINDKDLLQKLGQNAKSDIIAKYNVKLIEREYRNLFHEFGIE